MPQTTIAANFNEALDVKVNLFPEVALDAVFLVNHFTQFIYFILGKVIYLGVRADTEFGQNLQARSRAYAVYIL